MQRNYFVPKIMCRSLSIYLSITHTLTHSLKPTHTDVTEAADRDSELFFFRDSVRYPFLSRIIFFRCSFFLTFFNRDSPCQLVHIFGPWYFHSCASSAEIPHYWNDRAAPPDMPSPDLLIKQSGVSLGVLAVVANSGLMIVGDEETGTVEG